MTVSRLALPNYLPRSHIECREQRGSAMSLVVVGMAFDLPRTQWQQGLCPAQRLNLTLLIYSQYQSLLRRIKVKPDNVDHFLLQLGIITELEGFHTMGLQVVGLPYAMNRRVAYSYLLGQPTSTQMRHTLGWRQRWQLRPRAVLSRPMVRGRPGLGSSCSPSIPYSLNRLRQRQTVCTDPNSLPEMVLLFRPSAAANMISARRTNFCGVVGLLFHFSNVSRSASDTSIFLAIPAMPLLSHDRNFHSSHFRD